HVARDVHAAVPFEVPPVMVQLAHQFLFLGHRLEIDHGEVAAAGEAAVLVKHIGDATAHAGREIAPGLPDDDDHTAGHVFAAVIAQALDHRDGARIAHGEALAGDAAEIAFAL